MDNRVPGVEFRGENRNHPYRCWWVAALSQEVVRELLGRWLLDTPVLLYRREDGTVAALENRCPHRAAPLSAGRLQGDEVICGYHGFQFNARGICIRVPSQAHVPDARVRAFPVVESPPFVWVFLGNPDHLAGVPAPYSLEWASDPSFTVVSGRMDIAANCMLLKENVMDLTHFGYVHANSFGITDWTSPPRVEVEGDVVTYVQEFRDSPLAPVYAGATGVEVGKPFNRDNRGSFISPALQVASVDFDDPNPARGARKTFRLRVCHATTPVDPRRSRSWHRARHDGAPARGRLHWVRRRRGDHTGRAGKHGPGPFFRCPSGNQCSRRYGGRAGTARPGALDGTGNLKSLGPENP